jgi:phytoene/squalene synthetase
MSTASASLARIITRNSSKQSYSIACLLADRDLKDDCLRAYAYFRWADDVVDVSARTAEERIGFIERQKALIDACYIDKQPDDLTPEETMIADLIANDRGENSGLQSFIRSFIAVLDFDARRKDQFISQAELTWYSHTLGKAVTDAIQYFIGNDQPIQDSPHRYMAATAAHISHMLRDMCDDLHDGFINLPRELLVTRGFSSEAVNRGVINLDDQYIRDWVQDQVALARVYFKEGKAYLDSLNVLRCQIAGYWYCARFECLLGAIEQDDYVLRHSYRERHKLSTKLRMGWLALILSARYLIGRVRRTHAGPTGQPAGETYLEEEFGRTVATDGKRF